MYCNECNKKNPEGSKFCQRCGAEIKDESIDKTEQAKKSNSRTWFFVITLVILAIIILTIFYSSNTSDSETSSPPIQTPISNNNSENEIGSSVVNIFCPSTKEEIEPSGGSGTILSEDGIILTNSHIIPQDKTNILTDEAGCLVVLPDPTTGLPSEFFLAYPVVIPYISDTYDLAFMHIYSAFYDEEENKYAGTYPRKFPAFDDVTRCSNENLKLGEPITIYGYPAISGGYSLTITDGVVSSFPGDGTIVTSAKISHGNSGGLAVDKDGCMIGVPSLVSSDEYESFGVIYSMELVNEFTEYVTNYLNNLEQ